MTPPADKCAQCDLETLQLGGWPTWHYRDGRTYHFCSSRCMEIWKYHVDEWESEHERQGPADAREDRQ